MVGRRDARISILHVMCDLAVFAFVVGMAFLPKAITHAQLSTGWGVGGRFAPGACPPLGLGNCDIITFTPICGPVVTVIGPEGANQGAYVWGMPLVEPPKGPPYDHWNAAYATNLFPFTHAGLYMVGYAILPPPGTPCPLPILVSTGVSLYKAGF